MKWRTFLGSRVLEYSGTYFMSNDMDCQFDRLHMQFPQAGDM